ncbi:hypothetical protein H0H81_002336, partial [Sphagnurus paluster]
MYPTLLSNIVHPQVHTLSAMHTLILMRVIFNTTMEVAAILAACPALETLALFPAKPTEHGHGMTSAAVLHECATARLPVLHKFTTAFYARNEHEFKLIVKAFADLLHAWSKNRSLNRTGADLALFFCH